MPENLYQVVGGLQEAVRMGLETIRNRFERQDVKVRDLERRVNDLELCMAHFIKKENDEQQL